MPSGQLPNTFAVFVILEGLSVPFFYSATDLLMNASPLPWRKIVFGYAAGLILAYGGLAAFGYITPNVGRNVAAWANPVVTDMRWSLPIFALILVWIGGPRFVEKLRTAWQAKPQPQPVVSAPKKQMPPPSPEKVEAIRAFASVLESRPVGDASTKLEPNKPIPTNAQEKPKPRKARSAADERTLAMAREIDQESARHKAALLAFNNFKTTRPMTNLEEDKWIKLDVLFRTNNQELTLKFPPDTYDRDEDALLLLLYGYRQIYDREKVEARRLEHGLYSSGIRKRLPPQTATAMMSEMILGHTRDDRIDIDVLAKSGTLEGRISEKFALAAGGFYAITDKGLAEIEKVFDDLVRRA